MCMLCIIVAATTAVELACVSCGQGRFLSQITSVCETCPANSSTLDGVNATSVEACACDRGHSNASHSCHECVHGEFKARPGDVPCTPCQAHSNTMATGAWRDTDCICDAGHYETTPLACAPCLAGSFKTASGNQVCDICPADSYCGLGTVLPIVCPENSTSVPGSSRLTDCHCQPGFHHDEERECHACAAGKFQTLANEAACIDCPTRTYLPSVGASSPDECTPCGTNTHTDAVGSTAPEHCLCNLGYSGEPGAECVICGPGTFRAELGDYICAACPADSYNAARGSVSGSACLSCPENTSTTELSRRGHSTACVCEPGFAAFLEPGALSYACTPCAAGTFQAADNQTQCNGCEPGTYATVVQATSALVCLECADGRFTTDPAQTVCTACPVGTWQDAGNVGVKAVECSACPAHSTHAATAVTDVNVCVCGPGHVGLGVDGTYRCAECEPGSACPGNRTQTACPPDAWSPGGVFAGPCTPCAAHSRTVEFVAGAPQDSPEDCRCQAGAEGTFDRNCTLCAVGTFRAVFDGTSPAACRDCPADSFADTLGSRACTACPTHSSAPPGSSDASDCACDPGYFGPPGGPCALCPVNNFCPGGPVVNPCMAHGSTPEGASAITNCSCDAAYYASHLGALCTVCRPDHYCPGALNIYKCPANATSGLRAASVAQCVCDPGHWRGCVRNGTGHFVGPHGAPCVVDHAQPCSECAEDVICINNTLAHCQPHSRAPAGSHDEDHCVCDGGYREVHH